MAGSKEQIADTVILYREDDAHLRPLERWINGSMDENVSWIPRLHVIGFLDLENKAKSNRRYGNHKQVKRCKSSSNTEKLRAEM